MKKSIFNLLFMILCIVSWVLNPWPFSTSINDSKTDYIEKTKMVRGGFDPLQGKAKNSNPTRSKNDFIGQTPQSEQQASKQSSFSNSNTDFIGQTPQSEQQASKQSSFSNSNTDPKPKYRPMPGSNPGGSGNYDSDENLSNSGNSDQVISDPGFWNSLETLGESDAEEDSTPTEAPKPTPPTGKLTRQAIQDNDATTKMISPTEFNDWEGESRTIKSKELKKTVFAKGYDAGVVPVENLVTCPVQDDPTKFKRKNCGLITDQSVEKMRDKLIDLTTSRKADRVKLKLDMPFYDTEKATAYMDIKTGDCAFYHEDNGKYWSYAKYSKDEVLDIIASSDSITYAIPTNSNPEL